MNFITNEKNVKTVDYPEYKFCKLLDEANGCLNGCYMGVLTYTQTDFIQGGIHEDQEGFYVISGSGGVLIDDTEYPLSTGACFIIPPGKYHSIKRDVACESIKLFFFHAAV